MIENLNLLLCCLLAAGAVVAVMAIFARRRKFSALRWASGLLKKHRENIEVKRKVLLQAEAWHPGDPKVTFMRQFLNDRIGKFNRIVDRFNDEAGR